MPTSISSENGQKRASTQRILSNPTKPWQSKEKKEKIMQIIETIILPILISSLTATIYAKSFIKSNNLYTNKFNYIFNILRYAIFAIFFFCLLRLGTIPFILAFVSFIITFWIVLLKIAKSKIFYK